MNEKVNLSETSSGDVLVTSPLKRRPEAGRARRLRPIAVLLFAPLFCSVIAIRAQSVAPLMLARTISLPGLQGRIDHLAYDPDGERLFVCALGNNSVEVIDLRRGARVHSITGLGAPQGVAFVPELGRLFIAQDEGGLSKIYDGKTFRPLDEINLKDDADNVRYDSERKKIYVGYGNGGIAAIDAASGKEINAIKLSAHPEAFALEKNGARIFVNVPNAREVAVIDRDRNAIITTWQTDSAFANFPLALDEMNHRLFVGCRAPARLLAFDTDSGKMVKKVNICGDTDDVFYDEKRHRVYAICGAGKIEVIDQIDANNYKTLTSIGTADGARTGLFVPQLDTLFVAVPHRGSQPAEIRQFKVQ